MLFRRSQRHRQRPGSRVGENSAQGLQVAGICRCLVELIHSLQNISAKIQINAIYERRKSNGKSKKTNDTIFKKENLILHLTCLYSFSKFCDILFLTYINSQYLIHSIDLLIYLTYLLL